MSSSAETAKALHSTDANLILAVRDVAKGQELAQQIEEAGKGKGTINVLKLELDSLESVKSCAIEALKLSKTLNIFIANAGIHSKPHFFSSNSDQQLVPSIQSLH